MISPSSLSLTPLPTPPFILILFNTQFRYVAFSLPYERLC